MENKIAANEDVSEGVTSTVWPLSTDKHIEWFKYGKLNKVRPGPQKP